MNDPRPRKRRSPRSETSGDPRFQVYGLNLVVRMQPQEQAPYAVQCPRGQPIQYGEVVSRGDGYDAQAGVFREMPRLGSVVAFEETAEGVEGHYFFVEDEEFRILHLDAVDVAFPPAGEGEKAE